MAKINIVVLRGGPSYEYATSLKTGAEIINTLSSDEYTVHDVLISQDGQWYLHGLPVQPHQALRIADVAFVALHGHYGEDGKVQHILKQHNIPFTGSDTFASAITLHKARTKELLKNVPNIQFPKSIILSPDGVYDLEKEAQKAFTAFAPPYIIKPITGGSSIGIRVVNTIQELPRALEKAFAFGNIIVEELISGKEAVCDVIEQFRNEPYYTLPPTEVIPHKNSPFFDEHAKQNGTARYICPGNFSEQEKKMIAEMSIAVHKTLGLSHYSQSDFILHPKQGLFYLETNSLPGLTEHSILPHALEAVGASLSEFLQHIIGLALHKK